VPFVAASNETSTPFMAFLYAHDMLNYFPSGSGSLWCTANAMTINVQSMLLQSVAEAEFFFHGGIFFNE
jgi:short subunit fatty acids transporter